MGIGFLVLLASGVILVALSTLFVYTSLHPARIPVQRTPAEDGIAFENVSFPARDGVMLEAWWIPAGEPRGTVILCHGYPMNRSDIAPLIPFLHKAQYHCLAFDFRTLGHSEGRICGVGALETADLLGATDYARNRSDKPIAALGYSMGASVAVMAAALEPAIQAVIADSPYASLDRMAERRVRFLPRTLRVPLAAYANWLGGRLVGCNPADTSPLKVIGSIAPRPILLIHGEDDRLIPSSDSRELLAAAGVSTELWLVPGCRHVQAHNVDPEGYGRRVLKFLATTLPE